MTAPAAPASAGRRGWQALFLLALLCGLLVLLYQLRAIFIPLLVALALAYMWNPVVTALEKRGVARVYTIAIIYIVFFGGAGILALVGIPKFVHQGATFFEEVFVGEELTVDANSDGVWQEGDHFRDEDRDGLWDPPKITRLVEWSQSRLRALTGQDDFVANLRLLRERVKGHEGEIVQATGKALGTAAGWVAASLRGIFAALSIIVLVPVYMFFMLKNMDDIWNRGRLLIPAPYRERVTATLVRIHRANAAFFRGQVTIAIIEGVIVFLALTVFGVRFSFLFGVLYAVLAMVPFVGVAAMFAITELFVFVDTGGFTSTFFLVAGVFVVIQALEGLVLQPFILGKETGLHPIAIILSIFVFGELFGFLGVLLAIPLASATIIVLQDYLLPMVRAVAEDRPA